MSLGPTSSGPGPISLPDPASDLGPAAPAAAPVSAPASAPVRGAGAGGGRDAVMRALQPTGGDTQRLQQAKARIEHLMKGHTDRSEEREILQVFARLPKAELNALMAELDLHELLEDVDDRLFGPDNKTALLKLLTQTRLPDLDVSSRAALIGALQRGRTSDQEGAAAAQVLLGTRGQDLTALKNAVDGGGDHRDLQQLVFQDIEDGGLRNRVLQHIQKEAASSTGSTKVLSDIDDTFYASLHDERFPKGTVYPGVRAFYRALDQGSGQTPDRIGDLGFLTARPGGPGGLIEDYTHGALREKGIGEATVVSGDFAHLLGNDRIAEKKLENFGQVLQLYPEYQAVFLGDSGQGDAIAGAEMRAKHGQAVKGVFIHDVARSGAAERAAYAQKGVVFFDTYAGAAFEAFQKGLISRGGMADVARAAVEELKAVSFDSDAQRAARTADLARDLARINTLLPADQPVHV